jgi:cysteine sulfinate desulfinase/cysteine desulfurase-like protein
MRADIPVYLDYDWTKPMLPEVAEAVLQHLRGHDFWRVRSARHGIGPLFGHSKQPLKVTRDVATL